LFGTHVDMTPILELAKQHDLLVIEDCAQAFVGRDYAGHPDSDCALFSFGPIKTATALGGAALRVRDPALRAQMAEVQRAYPVQSRWSYFRRILKYAAFRFLSKRFAYGLLVRAFGARGIDYDHALGNAAHSFGASDFFQQIRRQPCAPLVRMLRRRIATFDSRGRRPLRRRTMRGAQLARKLPDAVVLGAQNPSHTYWVVPVRVANRDEILTTLRRAGFDATARSSLAVVRTQGNSTDYEPRLAPWLAETVFLPGADEMPEAEWERLIAILRRIARVAEPRSTSELVALPGVSVSS